MRATDHLALIEEAATLDAKPRLGKNQKARRATLADQLSHVTQPPPTPRRAPTGERGDFQGNVYLMHRRNMFGMNSDHGRTLRRNPSHGAVKYMRSRIQRTRRKQRTGGVK